MYFQRICIDILHIQVPGGKGSLFLLNRFRFRQFELRFIAARFLASWKKTSLLWSKERSESSWPQQVHHMQVNNPAIHTKIAKEVRKVSNSEKRCRRLVSHMVKFTISKIARMLSRILGRKSQKNWMHFSSSSNVYENIVGTPITLDSKDDFRSG